MTRAMIARSYGGPEALELVDEEPVEPAGDQVRIAVRAAGVNPSDIKSLSGQFGSNPDALPLRPGAEISGVVISAPDSLYSEGDEVVAYRVRGGFAEEVTAPIRAVFAKPASLEWAEAAGILLPGVTAWHTIDAIGLRPGDTLVVHGASGAVGSLAAQLALLRGADVVGTASRENFEYLESIGVRPVAHGSIEGLRAALPEGAMAAIDAVGRAEAIDLSLELGIPPERIATIGAFARGGEAGAKLLGGGPGADPGTALRNAARGPILELAGEGRLRLRMGPSFPLERAREALELVATGHSGGKVVLLP